MHFYPFVVVYTTIVSVSQVKYHTKNPICLRKSGFWYA